jgi:ELWxxDGT repeat protein
MTTLRAISAGLACSAALVGTVTLTARAYPPPHLRLIDLNTTGQSALSPYLDVHSFVAAGGTSYFPAWTTAAGLELWRSDGSEADTRLVADLSPGTLSSAPWQLTPAGDRLFFLASDGSSTERLCVTGPDIQGIRIVTGGDAWIGPITLIGAIADYALFTTPIVDRVGLYRADSAGNFLLLRTFETGPIGPAFGGTDVIAHDGLLYFSADDGVHGLELWRTDGSVAGTVLVADIVPGPGDSRPTALASVGPRLLLAATTPSNGEEPWVCMTGQVEMLSDVDAAPDPTASSHPEGFTLVNGKIVFAATSALGRELFITDGDAGSGSTRLLADIRPGAADGITGAFTPARVGNRLFFTADDGVHGAELWTTDGSIEGTHICFDLRPGPYGSNPAAIGSFLDSVIFQADIDDSGYRFWRTDADGRGPEPLSDLPVSDDPSTNRTTIRPWLGLGDALLFPAFRNDIGLELFRSHGHPGDAEPVTDIRSGTAGSSPGQFVRLGRGATFAARNELGIEPWYSDGTPAGTRMLADLAPGQASGSPLSIIGGDDLTLFRTGGQWWRTAPRDAGHPDPGTFPLGVAEPVQSSPPRACDLGQSIVFAGRTAATGDEVFISDGRDVASGGTRLLADIVPGPGSSSPFCFVCVGSQVLFFTLAPGQGRADLWRTDGTVAGTRRVVTVVNPSRTRVVSTSVRPVAAGDHLFFVADDGSGDELWASDGTDEGTFRVADINPGSAGSSPNGLAPVRDSDGSWRVFFAATDGLTGVELWVSGGAPFAGDTRRVGDIAPGPDSSNPITILPGRLDGFAHPGVCFAASNPQSGWELYFSDGSEDGTRRLTDIRPGPDSSVQSVLGMAGGAVYFRVIDFGSGSFTGQLYRSRGTPGAAWPVRDATGRNISPFSAMLPVNSRVFFSAADGFIGSELAVLDLCPADIDNSGVVDIADVLAFLQQWFAELGQTGSALVADHSRDLRVDVEDLFAFLGEFFAGCD